MSSLSYVASGLCRLCLSYLCLISDLTPCRYQQPDSSLTLRKLEKALRQEAEKLEEMKKERMVEVNLEKVGPGHAFIKN